ncbi:glycosyltransferase family 4 protein [Nocardioides sp. T2.26MG-1]|uniref:glycosyltransferase family 4 protein n=1 Tax=Nocardioides sp. T2.26MG-1 TaxID=3041166 RepID=UPI002477700B|nr:glycosyltransferase family 4 protein [Nocardioides sp. T2.26MG-1]CAI9398695.1 hypothetical protein HIDPHFAB_00047 [Nocardioides sp. T2.26MG-1]
MTAPAGPRVAIGLESMALGGCPINALDLASLLRGRGHQVSLFAVDSDAPTSIAPLIAQRGFDLTVLPARAGIGERARQIRAVARDHDVDVVHVFAPWLAPPLALALRSSPARVGVVTNWTMEAERYVPTWLPQVVGTQALRREVMTWHRAPVRLMEPPVDVGADRPDAVRGARFRSELGIAADELVVGVVSRLDRIMKAEGILAAIRATTALPDLPIRLVVVGDGDARGSIEAAAAAANQRLGRPATILTGASMDPRGAYDGADVVLGMGGSALRALAHARPLVVLGEQGFCRLFEPGSAAYFYEHGFYGRGHAEDVVPVLARILRGLVDPDRREQLGSFGRTEVDARFSLAAATDALEGLYEDALARPTGLTVRWVDTATRQLRTAARGLRTHDRGYLARGVLGRRAVTHPGPRGSRSDRGVGHRFPPQSHQSIEGVR